MILIADIGSTKGDWCLVDGDKFTSIQTLGFNPYFFPARSILSISSTEK